jgi:hypothetical protein
VAFAGDAVCYQSHTDSAPYGKFKKAMSLGILRLVDDKFIRGQLQIMPMFNNLKPLRFSKVSSMFFTADISEAKLPVS